MLADDSVTAQNMGRKILADAGYEVITVNNGSAALKKIAETKPDLIVLDVYMPGYSGLEVCQRLKESNETARIPILLTVGKLEPFKPEEARRVRAEGFIVKPFEASELLSALTKLEDKIVPRADSSKPGRFARAIAAVEEGRYDKTVPIDEDSGWRNRISFPSKKKEKPAEQEDGDDPAIYNAVNRDLKTFVEPRPAPQTPPSPEVQFPVHPAAQPSSQQQEVQVDLGALVAHGLPKDVTPEEIAALAAAAAQVQGIAEGRKPETFEAAPTSVSPAQQEESMKPEALSSKTEAIAQTDQIKGEPAPAEAPVPQVAQTLETAAVAPEVKPEEAEKSEAKQAATDPAPSDEKTSTDVAATFAPATILPEKNLPEKIAPEKIVIEKIEDEEPALANLTQIVTGEAGTSAPAEALPVIASFAATEADLSSGNGTSAHATSEAVGLEPVATPVAAVEAALASRWSAVAVALDPEEISVSLEEEMRQVQAAALAASLPAPASLAVEAASLEESAKVAEQAPYTEALPQPEASTATGSEPMVTEPRSEEPQVAAPVASPVVNEPANPVVKEFETVTPREPEPVPMIAAVPVERAPVALNAAEVAELPATISAIAESIVAESVVETKQPESISETVVINSRSEIVSSPIGTAPFGSQAEESEKEPVPAEPILDAVAHSPEQESLAETREPESAKPEEISVTQVLETQIPQESVESAAAVAMKEISGGLPDMAKKESEIAATTAAAWASWRRIRETGDTKSTSAPETESESAESPREESAMAVAAGAEKAPEEASGDSEVSPEIASIVDSVLADLRPKIVEEISRKLGKKK